MSSIKKASTKDNISTKSIMPLDEYIKYRLKCVKNSKRPAQPFKNINDVHKSQHISLNHNNWGILTGKQSNIIGVDLDTYKWKGEHSFNTKFGEDFIKKFDTLTQRTTKGGIHLLFQYDADIKQTQNEEHEIDIRSDGGFLVGAGSVVDGKPYTILNDTTIKKIPDDLKTYLLENLYTDDVKDKKTKATRTVNIDNSNVIYSYAYTSQEIEDNIVKELPVKYFTEYQYWLKFLTAMKSMGQYDIANKYRMKHRTGSSKWSDKSYFNTAWNAIKKHNDLAMVEHILKEAHQEHKLPYIKYKAIPKQIEPATKTIDCVKLGYGLELEENKNYVLKSDTGTGKTTIFKNYIGTKKFISIVSRITLADEQHRVFNEAGIDCAHYKIDNFIQAGESVVITVDSIMRINHLDFSKYVIFMDEFNSIIEYILQADTCLKEKRAFVVKILTNMLINSKQIIAVDADISDLCFKIFKKLDIDYEYIVNTYQHNKGVKASELFSTKKLLKQINGDRKNKKSVMVCCDSKSMAEYIFVETGKTAKLITAETTDTPVFDDHEFIIFSPKIIYGIDGNFEGGRNVYCVYREDTISPANMVQQMARERNINHLYYYFGKKKFEKCVYGTVEDCRVDMIKKHEYALTQFSIFEGSHNDLFFDMLVDYEYKLDCYKTNMFCHFLQIIKSRGIEIIGIERKTTKLDNDEIKSVALQLREETFDIESEYMERVNEYLQMNTKDLILDNKHLFIRPELLAEHFVCCEYFFKNQGMDNKNELLFDKLTQIKEFPIKKLSSIKNKILTIEMLKAQSNLTENIYEEHIIGANTPLTQTESDNMNKSYKMVYGGRTEPIDLTNIDNIPKMYVKMISNLCGKELITPRKVRKGTKTLTEYSLINCRVAGHKRLWNLRRTRNSLIQNYAGINISIEDDDDEECEGI